jgi:hypothetical protein
MLLKVAVTYLDETEEFVEINSSTVVSVEFLEDLSGLFFAELESVVNETPSEIIDIQLTVAVVIHGFEYSRDSFDTSSRSFQNFGLDFSYQIIY